MPYFAYGSNLNRDDLDRWCRERDLPAIELGVAAPAFLPDRRLDFNHRSKTRGGGVLDVVSAVGCAVAGIAFDAPDEVVMALDRKEGEGHVYRRIESVALTPYGREIGVFTYEVEPSHREPFVPPAAAYLEVVRRGYDAFALDRVPLEAAARGEAHAGPVTRLFVYGTLRQGEERHPALVRHGVSLTDLGQTEGTLYDLGPYPGMRAEAGAAPVIGELYEAPDLCALLTDLDDVESFRGFSAPGSLYRRAIVRVAPRGGDSTLAWTYLFAGDPAGAPAIASGDWRRR